VRALSQRGARGAGSHVSRQSPVRQRRSQVPRRRQQAGSQDGRLRTRQSLDVGLWETSRLGEVEVWLRRTDASTAAHTASSPPDSRALLDWCVSASPDRALTVWHRPRIGRLSAHSTGIGSCALARRCPLDPGCPGVARPSLQPRTTAPVQEDPGGGLCRSGAVRTSSRRGVKPACPRACVAPIPGLAGT
jgi:hypothetical protein